MKPRFQFPLRMLLYATITSAILLQLRADLAKRELAPDQVVVAREVTRTGAYTVEAQEIKVHDVDSPRAWEHFATNCVALLVVIGVAESRLRMPRQSPKPESPSGEKP